MFCETRSRLFVYIDVYCNCVHESSTNLMKYFIHWMLYRRQYLDNKIEEIETNKITPNSSIEEVNWSEMILFAVSIERIFW